MMSLMQLFLRLMLDPSRPPVDRRRKRDERGFTLTELMVVIFIIGANSRSTAGTGPMPMRLGSQPAAAEL